MKYEDYADIELAWSAGLFVGEGSFFEIRRGKNKDLKYLCAAIQMCDKRAIERFAHWVSNVLKITVLGKVNCKTKAGNLVFRVVLTGRRAEKIAKAMEPWLNGTDKGDQLNRVRTSVARPATRRIPRVQGELNPNASLKRPQILAIRRAMSNHGRLTHKEKYGMDLAGVLAKKYGVSKAEIHHIGNGRTW